MQVCHLRALVVLLTGLVCVGCSDETEPVDVAGSGAGGGGGDGGGGAAPTAGAQLPCAPGELEQSDGSCLAPGIPSEDCGVGFTPNADAACDPVLPSTPCGSTQMALPGDNACRFVGLCANGTWGDIPTDGTTQHVDASYTGGNSNGSSTAPYTTIQAAIDAAANGATVAIADGNYNESLIISSPVVLWGRCPASVTVTGAGQTVDVQSGADGSELRGVAITGSGIGVRVLGAEDVLLDEVIIHDTGSDGISADDSGSAASLTLSSSVIAAATHAAIESFNADVTLVDSVIRDGRSASGGVWGVGIDARGFGSTPDMSITLTHSVIDRARTRGISTAGPVTTTIEDSYLAHTAPEEASTLDGQAVFGYWQSTMSDGARPTITLRGSVVDGNTWISISTNGPDLVLESTVVRDTQRQPAGDGGGFGASLFAVETVAGGVRPRGTFSHSVIENSFINGIEINGAEAHIESCIVRGVGARNNGTNGLTVTAWPSDINGDPSDVTFLGGRFEQTKQGNIAVSGSEAVIDSIAVLDTGPRELDGAVGVPLAIMINPDSLIGSTATINRTVVDGGYGAGIVVAGSEATITDVLVRNIAPQQNIDDFGDGIAVSAAFPLLPDLYPASAELTRVTVEGMPRAGVAVFSTEASISDSLLSCNAIDLDGETYKDGPFSFEDGGGNVCSCDGELLECRVLTSNLVPPLGI